jgi:predicted ATP-grasp superfamily ATP-dependent carboligase
MNNILILDGMNKNTLAIVRHLGKMKVGKIHVVSYQKASICFFSRYVSKTYIIPNPSKEEAFVSGLVEILTATPFLLMIPVGYKSFDICTRHLEQFTPFTKLYLPPAKSLKIAADKRLTNNLAIESHVPVPENYQMDQLIAGDKESVKFPLVIKAPVELGKSIVAYAHNASELSAVYQRIEKALKNPDLKPLIQEYINGEGVGFFAYYEDGTCKRIFMHRRIREFPASGGASVCAEAFYDERLLKYGKALLDKLQWNGVAMIEFKKDEKSNEYKLMEINPKFWGSLDLSLIAHVNFPYFLVQRAIGNPVEQDFAFETNHRFQWLLNGELYHCIERPRSAGKIIRDLFRSKNDIWLRDPLPVLFQFIMIPIDIYKRWIK